MLPVLITLLFAQATGTHVAGQPYSRYATTDALGRSVTFYVSEVPERGEPLPLAVFIQGSGCHSVFRREGERIVPTSGHASLVDAVAGRARGLIVEKPGVEPFDAPDSMDARSCSETFRKEHSLARWTQAIEASMEAARRLPGVKPDGALIIGHSEGALVACRVARERPGIVSHEADVAGGAASQLASLVVLAREGRLMEEASSDPDERVRLLLDGWRKVQAAPEATDRYFLGHPYLRWSSFLASSPMEELAVVDARIRIAQGLADEAVDAGSAELLAAHLIARGRDVTLDLVPGASHDFRIPGEPSRDGWREMLDRAVAWWLPAAAPWPHAL
jgi:dienelactone hydrolase